MAPSSSQELDPPPVVEAATQVALHAALRLIGDRETDTMDGSVRCTMESIGRRQQNKTRCCNYLRTTLYTCFFSVKNQYTVVIYNLCDM